ncbi:trypsin-like peptidase domain-containing protein [Confluentibacter lentus]|uniref:trypsin-like peptidase domain-containing protein n=1 Tax=Confluentibacter lentus TaxID=1699412 RepID=UPI000C286497|nr:trypsin-like peptidase domain-containing protein [Confluentibacter lentus]
MSLTTENFSYSAFLSSMDFGVSTGSGFRLDIDDNEYLITAKHVIIDKNNNLRSDSFLCTSQNSIGEPEEAKTIIIDLSKSKISEFNGEDLVIVELIKDKNYEIQQEGINIISAKEDDLLALKDIRIASNVIQVGFPSSLYLEGFQFFDINRPLLRKGIVAGIHSRENTFIIDCPAFYGNSGGPVVYPLDNGETKIIGVISRYIPFVTEWRNKHERQFTREEFYNSGYAVCVPLDSIINHIIKSKSIVK